jgi:hypothetical protein
VLHWANDRTVGGTMQVLAKLFAQMLSSEEATLECCTIASEPLFLHIKACMPPLHESDDDRVTNLEVLDSFLWKQNQSGDHCSAL